MDNFSESTMLYNQTLLLLMVFCFITVNNQSCARNNSWLDMFCEKLKPRVKRLGNTFYRSSMNKISNNSNNAILYKTKNVANFKVCENVGLNEFPFYSSLIRSKKDVPDFEMTKFLNDIQSQAYDVYIPEISSDNDALESMFETYTKNRNSDDNSNIIIKDDSSSSLKEKIKTLMLNIIKPKSQQLNFPGNNLHQLMVNRSKKIHRFYPKTYKENTLLSKDIKFPIVFGLNSPSESFIEKKSSLTDEKVDLKDPFKIFLYLLTKKKKSHKNHHKKTSCKPSVTTVAALSHENITKPKIVTPLGEEEDIIEMKPNRTCQLSINFNLDNTKQLQSGSNPCQRANDVKCEPFIPDLRILLNLKFSKKQSSKPLNESTTTMGYISSSSEFKTSKGQTKMKESTTSLEDRGKTDMIEIIEFKPKESDKEKATINVIRIKTQQKKTTDLTTLQELITTQSLNTDGENDENDEKPILKEYTINVLDESINKILELEKCLAVNDDKNSSSNQKNFSTSSSSIISVTDACTNGIGSTTVISNNICTSTNGVFDDNKYSSQYDTLSKELTTAAMDKPNTKNPLKDYSLFVTAEVLTFANINCAKMLENTTVDKIGERK